mmetsp:Transcript_15765/g.42356  ORF Transcript_15765/g.42356 Transcript_15765/m.42356 type:complete len:229 (+) Transcript_15765:2451-3137(+)
MLRAARAAAHLGAHVLEGRAPAVPFEGGRAQEVLEVRRLGEDLGPEHVSPRLLGGDDHHLMALRPEIALRVGALPHGGLPLRHPELRGLRLELEEGQQRGRPRDQRQQTRHAQGGAAGAKVGEGVVAVLHSLIHEGGRAEVIPAGPLRLGSVGALVCRPVGAGPVGAGRRGGGARHGGRTGARPPRARVIGCADALTPYVLGDPPLHGLRQGGGGCGDGYAPAERKHG